MSEQDATQEPAVLAVTGAALEKVGAFRVQSAEPERQAMWVEATGSSGGEYTYDISLKPVDAARPGDVVQHHGDLPVVIPEASVEKLRGATLDWIEQVDQSGLSVTNPNQPKQPEPLPMLSMMPGGAGPGMEAPASPPIPAGPPPDLSGDVAQRVIAVLEEQINPAIAAHGGRADLVAVEEEVAYLRLGGGCQGCGLAAVTLSQGIEGAILEAVVEIEQVVDVTDHAAGANPYFEPAKK